MSIDTRELRSLAACICCCALVSGFAQGQTYPEKPVRLIVPYAPVGNADTLARIISQRLAQSLEQPFIVENMSGASGVIGTAAIAALLTDRQHLEATPVHELMEMLVV